MKKIKQSITNEINLLMRIIEKPLSFAKNKDELLDALKNQTSFSKFESQQYEIISYSLNTHKQYINLYSIKLFNEFDNLRKSAYKSLKKEYLDNDNQKKVQKPKKDQINSRIFNAVVNDNILLNSIIQKLINKLEVYALKSQNIEIINDLKFSLDEIEKIMSNINEI